MQLSMTELAKAREVITALLEELQLDAWLFEVEPGEPQWEVIIECAVAEGWETVRLPVAKEVLLRSERDPAAHRSLLDDWRKALAACRIKQPPSD